MATAAPTASEASSCCSEICSSQTTSPWNSGERSPDSRVGIPTRGYLQHQLSASGLSHQPHRTPVQLGRLPYRRGEFYCQESMSAMEQQLHEVYRAATDGDEAALRSALSQVPKLPLDQPDAQVCVPVLTRAARARVCARVRAPVPPALHSHCAVVACVPLLWVGRRTGASRAPPGCGRRPRRLCPAAGYRRRRCKQGQSSGWGRRRREARGTLAGH